MKSFVMTFLLALILLIRELLTLLLLVWMAEMLAVLLIFFLAVVLCSLNFSALSKTSSTR